MAVHRPAPPTGNCAFLSQLPTRPRSQRAAREQSVSESRRSGLLSKTAALRRSRARWELHDVTPSRARGSSVLRKRSWKALREQADELSSEIFRHSLHVGSRRTTPERLPAFA